MIKYTLTWKGWRFYVDGDTCVATDTRRRLTTPMPTKATEQQSFFLASEQLKNDIRNLGRAHRDAARGQLEA